MARLTEVGLMWRWLRGEKTKWNSAEQDWKCRSRKFLCAGEGHRISGSQPLLGECGGTEEESGAEEPRKSVGRGGDQGVGCSVCCCVRKG